MEINKSKKSQSSFIQVSEKKGSQKKKSFSLLPLRQKHRQTYTKQVTERVGGLNSKKGQWAFVYYHTTPI